MALPGFLRLPVSEDRELMAQQKRLYPAVFVDQTSAMLLGLVNVQSPAPFPARLWPGSDRSTLSIM